MWPSGETLYSDEERDKSIASPSRLAYTAANQKCGRIFMAIARIVVLGDSVAWGQGLEQAHKYAQLLSGMLTTAGAPAPIVEIYAHSGAVIDPQGTLGDSVAPCRALSGEIPAAAPSIRAQLRTVATPETADLVLLDGSINDVEVARIVNPFTRQDDLARYIQENCYAGVKTLLAEAAAAFTGPSTRLVFTGYYPILSAQSDQSLVGDFLSTFGVAIHPSLAMDLIMPEITKRTLQFWQQSDAAFRQAIQETAASTGLGNRLIYVPGPMTEANSVFAPTPWIFGLQDGLEPEDEVIDERRQACTACQQKGLNPAEFLQCCLASVGHPNPLGAAAYAQAIYAQLTRS